MSLCECVCVKCLYFAALVTALCGILLHTDTSHHVNTHTETHHKPQVACRWCITHATHHRQPYCTTWSERDIRNFQINPKLITTAITWSTWTDSGTQDTNTGSSMMLHQSTSCSRKEQQQVIVLALHRSHSKSTFSPVTIMMLGIMTNRPKTHNAIQLNPTANLIRLNRIWICPVLDRRPLTNTLTVVKLHPRGISDLMSPFGGPISRLRSSVESCVKALNIFLLSSCLPHQGR